MLTYNVQNPNLTGQIRYIVFVLIHWTISRRIGKIQQKNKWRQWSTVRRLKLRGIMYTLHGLTIKNLRYNFVKLHNKISRSVDNIWKSYKLPQEVHGKVKSGISNRRRNPKRNENLKSYVSRRLTLATAIFIAMIPLNHIINDINEANIFFVCFLITRKV